MPLYEYKCQGCGELFEVRQNFADAPLTTHEKCGGTVQRLISAPALQFKGSGFYINDYAKGSGGGNGKPKAGESQPKGESKTDSSSSSSTPAAPSTSTDTKK